MSFAVVPTPQRSPILGQVLAALAGGILFFMTILGVLSGGYRLLYTGRIFPGISMAGVDLSSMTPAAASIALERRLTYPASGQIVFRDGNRVWVASPAELGLVFDSGKSVQQAYELGRQDRLFNDLAAQINAWQAGLDLAPVIIYDERVAQRYLQAIATQINQPLIETDLHLNGVKVEYTAGQAGRLLNTDQTLVNLLRQLSTFRDGEVTLAIEEQQPMVPDASQQVAILQQALGTPLRLVVPEARAGDPGPWTIDSSVLAEMLSVKPVESGQSWQYQISVNGTALDQFLSGIAPLVNRNPQNARFYFDDPTRELVLLNSSRAGQTLDLAATREQFEQKLLQGEHTVELVLVLTQPEVGDDATAASLGITGLVSSNTSYFRGSSSARMQNIDTARRQFHGLLVPPNSTFSMAEALGDVSLENGYAEALIIYNGRSITGVGGGVCQVSTTLFRTLLDGGYPIVERHEHAYRVGFYEQTATGYDSELAGRDATVYVPLVDLKFTNDRPYWLLMETYFHPDQKSLEWKFYSGEDGRMADVRNLEPMNVVPAPEPLFVENPDLGPGTCKQKDYAADGADITITRIVSRGGDTLFTDTVRTHYEPWQAVYDYGPGTENPQSLVDRGLCH